MGFYSNIIDNGKTVFQFDKVFLNRATMEQAAAAGTDEIFPGRFILISYDQTGNDNNEYENNYLIDKNYYENNFDIRGYDSTIWEKVYKNGNGYFVFVARIKGAMPAIEVVSNLPSNNAESAYFEATDQETIYRLHVPSQWGFRIKEATNQDLSDEQLIQTYYTYDENNNITDIINRSISAEIYFNKDGFSKGIRHYDNNNENIIIIAPTGESGKVYYNDETIDTYELAVHLPIFGNIISDFYDMFYSVNRNLDTTWYEGDSSFIETGDSQLNGKTRDLNTVAGLINTFQDRLGQNIITLNNPISNDQAAILDPKFIYKVNDTYYKIGYDYDYSIVPEYSLIGTLTEDQYEPNKYYIYNNNDYSLATSSYSNYSADQEFFHKNINYIATTLNENEYAPNTYYIKNNNAYNIATENYSYYPNGQVFYKKDISPFKFEEVQLIGYQKNTYYYRSGSNYLLDTHEDTPLYKTQPYYNITNENLQSYTFTSAYIPGQHYIKDNEQYKLSHDIIPDPLTTYYNISSTQLSNGSRILYQPGKYYWYESYDEFGQPIGNPRPDYEDTVTSGRIYWMIPLSDEPTYVYTNGQVVVGYTLNVENKVRVNLFSPNQPLSSIYIYNNETYIPAIQIEDLSVAYQYYSLTITELTNYFIANMYYRPDIYNNYYLQSSWSGDPNMVYYKLVNLNPLTIPFYESDTYYYFNGNIYVIDTSVSLVNAHLPYYKGSALYVYEDFTQRWPFGFEWQEQAVFVPASVQLATRTAIKKPYELQGINNGMSSINGTILEMSQLISADNYSTRDKNTVTGVINTVNDLLYSIKDNLIPGRILYVNDFGQISVSSITIQQLENLINNSH